MNFDTIEYLKTGNQKQIAIYDLLVRNKIMDLLATFDPILTGTFPINIDIESSDLDIICYWRDKNEFTDSIKKYFGNQNDFAFRETIISGNETVVANFVLEGFAFEVFGQNIPVRNQYAYRHMVIEYEILKARGEDFRRQVIALKKSGLKTEPAFAQLLGLNGNSYEELLKYKMN